MNLVPLRFFKRFFLFRIYVFRSSKRFRFGKSVKTPCPMLQIRIRNEKISLWISWTKSWLRFVDILFRFFKAFNFYEIFLLKKMYMPITNFKLLHWNFGRMWNRVEKYNTLNLSIASSDFSKTCPFIFPFSRLSVFLKLFLL